MAKSRNKYFVVWKGLEPGVYASWNECKRQVQGYPDAIYKGFPNHEEAVDAYYSSCWDYVGKSAKKKEPDISHFLEKGEIEQESLAVDAACSGNPGVMEYRGVYTKTGEEIFRRGPFGQGTNNIGEFLALVHCLALLKQNDKDLPIYTDSKTALSWVRNKAAKTKLEKTPQNAILFDLIERAEKWLRENSYNTPIFKWNTKEWGEIPADFGRK